MSVIPNLPTFFDFTYTNKDGSLTPNAKLYNDLMYQILRQLLAAFNQNFDVGTQLPNKTTAEITAYANDTNIPLGTLWFNSTIAELQFKSAPGAIKTVTAT